jgi:hypothetical protein
LFLQVLLPDAFGLVDDLRVEESFLDAELVSSKEQHGLTKLVEDVDAAKLVLPTLAS